MDTQSLVNLAVEATSLIWAHYGKELAEDFARAGASKARMWTWRMSKKAASSVWNQVNWKASASKYNERLRRLYGTTNVLGKTEPIELEGIFTDVYMLDQPTATRRFDIERLRRDPELLTTTHKRIDGMSLVTQKTSENETANNRLFILGKPGAGKTTFLKYLVWQATLGNIDKTPIFISLKEWSDSKSQLIPFMSSQFDICGFPEAEPFVLKILNKGTAIVLFDGLDEVKLEDRQRQQTIDDLRDFTNKYEKVQCIVTCRIAATSYSFDKFRYVEVADFTDEQVNVYVEKWFGDQPSKLNQFFTEMKKSENKNLRELCSVPLLLSLLCLAFDSTMTFPKRRVEIYEEAVEALMKKWDAARAIPRDDAYKGLSLGRKRQMFARLAATTFQANQYFVPEKQFVKDIVKYLVRLPESLPEEDIDGSAVLKSIEAQHGILCERASQIYSFAHLTFQEYFAARYIVEEGSGAIQRLITDRHVADPRWREIILLTASLLDDADEYMACFQKAIDRLITDDSAILHFLGQIHAKSLSVNSSKESARIRAFYWCLAFNSVQKDLYYQSLKTTLDLNLLRAHLEPDLALARNMETGNEHAKSIYYARAALFDLAATLDLALTRTIDQSVPGLRLHAQSFVRVIPPSLHARKEVHFEIGDALDFDLTNLITNCGNLQSYESTEDRQMQIDLHLSSIASYGLVYNWWPSVNHKLHKYIQVLMHNARLMSLNKLEADLEKTAARFQQKRTMQEVASQHLCDGINAILQERMVGSPWIPNDDQCSKLLSYFNASLLFLEALEVAAVSNRDKIRNGLFMPSIDRC